MKFLLLILAVLALLFLLQRSWRGRGGSTPPPDRPAVPQAMLSCAQCGLHLPADEALPGRGGVFCGEPHRAAYERAHPE
jgi:uncharacterized protein